MATTNSIFSHLHGAQYATVAGNDSMQLCKGMSSSALQKQNFKQRDMQNDYTSI